MNRFCEFRLHDVEFLASMAHIQSLIKKAAYKFPTDELHRLWKLLLLNQFHDVLPGTSIGLVSSFEDTLVHTQAFRLEIPLDWSALVQKIPMKFLFDKEF